MSAAGERSPRIGVVDYGMGNRRSAEKALEHVGARVEVSGDPRRLRAMDGLVLPGVGAFPAAMTAIRAAGLDEFLQERVAAGVPLLGLCLGMQLLFERSEEHDGATGLGLLTGTVRRLNVPGLKLPHIGWSELRWLRASPLSEGLPDPAYLYHVHSFAPCPADREWCWHRRLRRAVPRDRRVWKRVSAHNHTRRSPPRTGWRCRATSHVCAAAQWCPRDRRGAARFWT